MDNTQIKTRFDEALQLQFSVLNADIPSSETQKKLNRITEIAFELKQHNQTLSAATFELLKDAREHLYTVEASCIREKCEKLYVPPIVILCLAYAANASSIFIKINSDAICDFENDYYSEEESEEEAQEAELFLQEAFSLFEEIKKSKNADIRKYVQVIQAAVLSADREFQKIGGGIVLQ